MEDVGETQERKPGRLAREVGKLLRQRREFADLTQAQLARRTGVSQQMLARLESGARSPTTASIERAFAGLGVQLKLGLEALDADMDAAIAADPQTAHRAKQAYVINYGMLRSRMRDLDHRIDGQLAAALYGLQLLIDAVDVAVAESDFEQLAEWINRLPNTERWFEERGEFRPFRNDPHLPGSLRWLTPICEVRVRLMPELPAPVTVRFEETELALLPMADLISQGGDVARALGRMRAQDES